MVDEKPERQGRRAQHHQPKADTTTTPLSAKSNELKVVGGDAAQLSSTSGQGGRPASNNMSRRRNRINANLLTAEELEEKTKTDAAANGTA